MRLIDHIASDYPDLDLTSVRILLTVYENPGFSIREVADVLGLSAKTTQVKISLMAEGRKNRPRASRRRLINIDRRLTDRRKRDLMLTDRGSELAELLLPLAEAQP